MQRKLLMLLLLILGLAAGTAFGQQKPTRIVREKISVPVGKNVTFHSRSVGAEDWTWDFGDGNQAFSPDVTHRFDQVGTYVVRLEVGNGSCAEVVSREVEVFAPDEMIPGMEGHLFPNPASSISNLELSGEFEGKVDVRLIGLEGKVLWETQLEKSSAKAGLEIPVEHLAGGTYLVQIQFGFEQQTLRLLKI